MSEWSRRLFFSAGAGALLAAPAAAAVRFTASRAGGEEDASVSESAPASFPAQGPTAVRGFVTKAHFDLDAVKSMAAKRPALAKACWDWGFGDWESALGAASHTGRADIAEVLIAHGARPNVFTFAMLGQLEAVRAIVEANPGVQRIHGPHGITLLAHAKAGGERATRVVEYLESIGGADPRQSSEELSDELKAACLGLYAYGPKTDERLNIVAANRREGSDLLAIQRGSNSARPLLYLGDHTFHPAAAQAVRIFFNVEGERASTLTVHDGDLIVTARRVER